METEEEYYCSSIASKQSKKRKSSSPPHKDYVNSSIFPLDQLNQDLLEQVLSWLPTSNILQITSVSKKWKSISSSPTFHLACSHIPSRQPWFYMVSSTNTSDHQSNFYSPPIVFDSSVKNWKNLKDPSFLKQKCISNWVPVASSGGLLCFLNTEETELIVTNPVTDSHNQTISLKKKSKNLKAIAMLSSGLDYYKIVLVSGDLLSDLCYTVYNSKSNEWEEAETKISRKIHSLDESNSQKEENPIYFLSKCGNVVSTDIQRNPCKKFSSIVTQRNGEEKVHFLSSFGNVVTCNLTTKCFYEFPRLLPLNCEYSFDLVECKGEVYVVVVQEFLESASLRVWRFDETERCWHQVAAMPPAMSHGFYGKMVDINCSGGVGEQIFVCLNSANADVCSYFLCNLVGNEWIELPKCYVNGNVKDFCCAFVFEPRIEARV